MAHAVSYAACGQEQLAAGSGTGQLIIPIPGSRPACGMRRLRPWDPDGIDAITSDTVTPSFQSHIRLLMASKSNSTGTLHVEAILAGNVIRRNCTPRCRTSISMKAAKAHAKHISQYAGGHMQSPFKANIQSVYGTAGTASPPRSPCRRLKRQNTPRRCAAEVELQQSGEQQLCVKTRRASCSRRVGNSAKAQALTNTRASSKPKCKSWMRAEESYQIQAASLRPTRS